MLAFYWDEMRCELCNQQFKRELTVNGKIVDMVGLSKLEKGKYIIFEIVSENQNSTYLVQFNEDD